MAASRIDSCQRVLRRYRLFLFISIAILAVQCFIASTIFSINKTTETAEKPQTAYEGSLKHDEPPGGAAIDSESKESRDVLDVVKNVPNGSNQNPNGFEKYKIKVKCELNSKEAVSAIHRAKTNQCRQNIANIACDIINNKKIYPDRLPRFCPLKGNDAGKYIGCYQDKNINRDLSGPKTVFDTDNNPEKCWNHCLTSGYKFAGVQFGVECWCGSSYGQYGKLSDQECHMTCPGGASQWCGSHLSQAIYHTGYGEKPHNTVQLVKMTNAHLRKPARIVYVLTVNGRSLRQVKRLLKALYYVNHYFYIHVDARQDYLYRELSELAKIYFNVRLTSWRMSTIWGGASLLQMLLRCMDDLLKMNDWNWDFFINLSESDYPLKTSDAITAFLTTYRKNNFLKSHGRDTPRFIRKQGMEKIFYECDTHMWKIGNRKLPSGIRIDGGSDWISLNREFCHYLAFSTDALVTGLKKVYEHTLLPAESFFHTLIQNSQFCTTVVDNNLHITNWRRKQGCKCQHKHVVDWCGCSPNDFKMDDWRKILLAEHKALFFARKFEAVISQSVINKLDAYLFGDQRNMLPGINAYWQNEYHHVDKKPVVDNGRFSFYESFARLGVQNLKMQSSDNKCNFNPLKVLESHIFNHEDSFQGVLVLYEASCDSSPYMYKMETFLRPKVHLSMAKTKGPISRLKSMNVGSDWDPKEEVFRNFGHLLGPQTDIGVRHEWNAGAAFMLSMVWVDPAKVIAASFDVPITEGEHIGFYKPNFVGPLRPGVWKLIGLISWDVVITVEFLIVPLSHLNKQHVTKDHVIKFHSGPASGQFYKDNRDFSDFKDIINLDNSNQLALKTSRTNQIKTGQDLHNWIDELSSQFWSVISTCVVKTNLDNSNCDHLSACQTTYWSSLSPDPKSETGQVNPQTGLLE